MKDKSYVVTFMLTLYIMLVSLAVGLELVLNRNKDEQTVADEYCMLETFQPRCLKNEVILMKSATYGRMRIGRCITAEEIDRFGSRYLGCSSNVLPILDRKCSGKAECDVRLSDISVENIKPCVAGLTVYLEASYTCIAIADEGRSCTIPISTNPLHISTLPLSKRNCGIKSQPWYAVAPAGQTIKISLLQFSTSTQTNEPSEKPCLSHGFIVDKAGKVNTSICVGDGMPRDSELYLSTGNAVEIFINQSDERETSARKIILRLETVGCSDIIPPEDAWLKRNDNTIVIGCYSSRQTWHLSCEGTKWIGVFGNCSQDSEASDLSEESQPVTDKWSDRQILATVAIGGLTILICLSILCIGTVCLRRFSVQNKKLSEYNTVGSHSTSGCGLRVDHRLALGIATGLHGNELQECIPPEMPSFPVYIGRSEDENTFEDRVNARCVNSSA